MIKNMSRYERKTINEKLRGELNKYCDTYSQLSEAARVNYFKNMKAGEVAPKQVYLSGVYADEFTKTVDKIKQNVSAILDPVKKQLREEYAVAPSQDAINTITLLGTRKNIDQEELSYIIDMYGDNVQAYNAIRDIASNHNIHLAEHEISSELENVESIERSVSKFSLAEANNGKASEGYVEFIGMNIDTAFPPED